MNIITLTKSIELAGDIFVQPIIIQCI